MRALGIDTSNYTTSAAVFDGSGGYNAGRLLEVRPGELGLRQSDALFQHIKHLPGRFAELRAEGWLTGLPVLCSGGVASNRLLRTVMSDAAFAAPQYSTDNAMGAAILAWRSLRQEAEA